jgi:hypothetical protein
MQNSKDEFKAIIPITDSVQVRIQENFGWKYDKQISIYKWVKWSSDGEFHPKNGVAINADIFKREVLPVLLKTLED